MNYPKKVILARTVSKYLSILIIFSISVNSYARRSKKNDPDWQTKIITKTGDETITGSGYIVNVGDKFYVRTASHVTMGKMPAKIKTGKGEVLHIIPGGSLVDVAHDDQLIEIKPPKKSKAIGFYSPNLNSFVAYPKQYKKLEKNKRVRDIETGYQAAFYVLPSWSKENPGKLERKNSSAFSPVDPGFLVKQRVRLASDQNSFAADISVNPGESGSPVFKKMDTLFAFDMDKKLVDFKFRNSNAGAVLIPGHVQNYNRFFERSNFSAPSQAKFIVNKLLDGETGELNKVIWNRHKGIFYRSIETEKGLIQEVVLTSGKAGSGTKGDGGSGTKGDGGSGTKGDGGCKAGSGTKGDGGSGTKGDGGCKAGSGTKGDGGSGTKGDGGCQAGSGTKGDGGCVEAQEDGVGMGMIYHDIPTVAFRVKEISKGKVIREYSVYADWENYQSLADKKIAMGKDLVFEPIPLKDGVANLIDERASKSSSNARSKMESCLIYSGSLADNFLTLNLKGFKNLDVELDPGFFPVQIIRNRDTNEKFTIDLRGLFSADLTELSTSSDNLNKSEFDTFLNIPYITIKKDGYSSSRFHCKLIAGGTRRSSFNSGRYLPKVILPDSKNKRIENQNKPPSALKDGAPLKK